MTEINENSALKNDDWRSVIDGIESNWYLKHQKDYGSWNWIKRKLFVWASPAVIAFGVGDFLRHFPQFFDNLPRMFWICHFSFWTLSSFVPLLILYYILYHIPILDDAIGLKKEIKSIVVMYSIILVLWFSNSIIYPSILLIDDQFPDFRWIISPIWILLRRILIFLINYMQTR